MAGGGRDGRLSTAGAVERYSRALRAVGYTQLALEPVSSEALERGGDVGHGAASFPHFTHSALQLSGSTCTTSLRPQIVQKRGGSLACRRRSQAECSPSPAGRPHPAQ
jgi:hypothetical protein